MNILVPNLEFFICNKNIITLVFSGRPLVIKPFQSSAALVYCWHLGQKAGDSIAKLLIGNENFSGKLSVSLLENTGQIPMYYNRKKVGRPYLKYNQSYKGVIPWSVKSILLFRKLGNHFYLPFMKSEITDSGLDGPW